MPESNVELCRGRVSFQVLTLLVGDHGGILVHESYVLVGRTFFPDAREVVRLEFGEFILHPGSLVHSGADIRSGTRHLMVIFAQISHVK